MYLQTFRQAKFLKVIMITRKRLMWDLLSSYKCLFKTCFCHLRTSHRFSIIKQSRLYSKIYNIGSPQLKSLTGSTSEAVCNKHIAYYYRKQQCANRPRYFTSIIPSPIISLSHIKQTLDLHKFIVKDGFTCLQTRCVFCQETGKPAGSSGDYLFINKVTGRLL